MSNLGSLAGTKRVAPSPMGCIETVVVESQSLAGVQC